MVAALAATVPYDSHQEEQPNQQQRRFPGWIDTIDGLKVMPPPPKSFFRQM
jgi:hypothetical protein